METDIRGRVLKNIMGHKNLNLDKTSLNDSARYYIGKDGKRYAKPVVNMNNPNHLVFNKGEGEDAATYFEDHLNAGMTYEEAFRQLNEDFPHGVTGNDMYVIRSIVKHREANKNVYGNSGPVPKNLR